MSSLQHMRSVPQTNLLSPHLDNNALTGLVGSFALVVFG